MSDQGNLDFRLRARTEKDLIEYKRRYIDALSEEEQHEKSQHEEIQNEERQHEERQREE